MLRVQPHIPCPAPALRVRHRHARAEWPTAKAARQPGGSRVTRIPPSFHRITSGVLWLPLRSPPPSRAGRSPLPLPARAQVAGLEAQVQRWKQRADEYEIKAALHERHLDEVTQSRMEFRNEVTLLEAELVQVRAELDRARRQEKSTRRLRTLYKSML